MKERYFSTKTGEEVKLGDKLVIHYKEKTSVGIRIVTEKIKITKDILGNLLDSGLIRKQNDNVEDSEVIMELGYYIDLMAMRQGWDYHKMARFLNKVFEINKTAALNMLLKEIAIEFDMKYNGHISQSDEIWVVSLSNGETVSIDKDNITSYKNFAAFRTAEDALAAWTIVKPLIMNMFTDEEEYKNIRIE